MRNSEMTDLSFTRQPVWQDGIMKLIKSKAELEPRFHLHRALLKFGRYYEVNPKPPKGFRRGKMGRCYGNSAKYAVEYIGERFPYFHYAEGYAIRKNTRDIVPHAWLVNWDGLVSDVTLKDAKDVVYFGVTFTPDYVSEAIEETGLTGILCNKALYPTLFANEQAFQETLGTPKFPDAPMYDDDWEDED